MQASLRAAALAATGLLLSCSATGGPAAAAPLPPAVQAELERLDALEAPMDADPRHFELLRGELRRVLQQYGASATPAPPQRESSRVGDLRVVELPGGARELQWSYRNTADYDRNGEVNAADIVPLARHFAVRWGDAEWDAARRADGDANGELNAADIVPIGAALHAAVDAYAVQGRSGAGGWEQLGVLPLSSPAEPLRFALAGSHDWYRVVPQLNGVSGAASYSAYAEPERIEFAGRRWIVRRIDGEQGPGPNRWSALPAHASVEDGMLRLAATHGPEGYACAEVYSEDAVGYGTYVFHIETPARELHRDLILGLFTYDFTDAGFLLNANSEIDIELGRFGADTPDYLNFAVQPSFGTEGGIGVDFPERIRSLPPGVLEDGASTHVFRWTPTSVRFASYPGSAPPTEAQLATWSFGPEARTWAYTEHNPSRAKFEDGLYSAPVVIPTPGAAGVHINLWWFRQNLLPSALPPVQEVRISGFSYMPL